MLVKCISAAQSAVYSVAKNSATNLNFAGRKPGPEEGSDSFVKEAKSERPVYVWEEAEERLRAKYGDKLIKEFQPASKERDDYSSDSAYHFFYVKEGKKQKFLEAHSADKKIRYPSKMELELRAQYGDELIVRTSGDGYLNYYVMENGREECVGLDDVNVS